MSTGLQSNLKQFRRIAARYEKKIDESFAATIHLAGSLFALK
jgi:hypothetical protein